MPDTPRESFANDLAPSAWHRIPGWLKLANDFQRNPPLRI
jgi:hypothetical protein